MGRGARSTAGFRRTNNLLLRLLAGIYFFAFASLIVQINGLCGPSGILPASSALNAFAERLPGVSRFWTHPTLFWLGAGNAWLTGGCIAGLLASLAAAAGLFPAAAFAACFLLYLSFFTVCGPFLHFQWDLLLLESGFLALFAAPLRAYASAAEPPAAVRMLFRFLFFKLMLESGLCKLAGGDPAWRTLEALRFHYETQPLPPWTAWYFHHAPDAFGKFCTALVLFIEIVTPFFLFLGRRPRIAAFALNVFLQLMIVLTGNYGFFNWITIVLAVSLLDDAALGAASGASRAPSAARRFAAAAFLAAYAPLSFYLGASRWLDRLPRIEPVDRYLSAALESWPVAGTYGLFAVMTTERREVVLEGSDDGEHWQEYEFRWKPGDPRRRPSFTGPHMPRLDWQMWFAALGTWRQNPWLLGLSQRLLEGERSVNGFFRVNPFPHAPPRYIRAVSYEYRFSRDLRSGWWTRDNPRLYLPALKLQRH